MHISNVKGLPDRDLQITFSEAVALRWERESPGVERCPIKLPKLTGPEWSQWTFPLLKIQGAEWLKQWQPIYGQKLEQFMLVSMNDLLHVVAGPTTQTLWVPGRAPL
jgi:hypothetical protein